jgi:serine/threonine-protein kinase PknK
MSARYVTAALVKSAEGDRDAAASRLADGMKAAEKLQLPRLAAGITNARIRLGIAITPEIAVELRSPRAIPRGNGIATITAELDEDSGVRLLSASDSPDERAQACQRAWDLVAGIDDQTRPWAALRARLLLIQTLTAADRVADAAAAAVPVVAKCSELGLSRLLADAGLG